MIVGRPFLGEDDSAIAWKQHDVYWDALRVIVRGCNKLTRFAKTLLDDPFHPEWGEVGSYDHRTLQDAHDLLAAVWRFRTDLRQLELSLERAGEPFTPRTPEAVWLSWLHREVETWIEAPDLVRNVQLILTHQNEPTGYIAEARLCLTLLNRFSDVPWNPAHHEAHQADLEAELAKLSPVVASSKSNKPRHAPEPCECTAKRRPPCGMIPCKTTAARATREGWGPLE